MHTAGRRYGNSFPQVLDKQLYNKMYKHESFSGFKNLPSFQHNKSQNAYHIRQVNILYTCSLQKLLTVRRFLHPAKLSELSEKGAFGFYEVIELNT